MSVGSSDWCGKGCVLTDLSVSSKTITEKDDTKEKKIKIY